MNPVIWSFGRSVTLILLLIAVRPEAVTAQQGGAALQVQDTSFAEVRQRVLREIAKVLNNRAFSVTGEFARWAEVQAAHSEANSAAGNEAEFVAFSAAT